MGAFNSKQWAEVLTTGSPGSPDASASRTEAADSAPICDGGDDDKVVENNGEEEDRPRPRQLKLQDLDPQSASDNVERTPFEAEEKPSEADKTEPEADKTEPEADKTESDADKTESDVEDEENDTSGKELLSQELMDTPTGIDKQLHMFKHLAIDPRSPSTGVNRTPIVVESPLLSSEDSDTPKKVPEAKAPKRGMFANALASH